MRRITYESPRRRRPRQTIRWQSDLPRSPTTEQIRRVLQRPSGRAPNQPLFDGVRRVARIIGEEAFEPAQALYDEVEAIDNVLPLRLGSIIPQLAFTQENLMRTNATTVQKMQVNRTSMVKRGKSHVKKEKPVRVSKSLREKVTTVLEGHEAIGVYKTTTCGYVCSLAVAGSGFIFNVNHTNAANNRFLGGVVLPVANSSTFAICLGDNRPPGRTMWNGMLAYSTVPYADLDAARSAYIPGSDLNFFTIGKITNAAAILFNDKAPTCDPYNTTGNLSESIDPGNGAALSNIPGSLKIHLKSSYAKFTMKNVSARVVYLEFWEIEPSIKFQAANPFFNLRAAAAALDTAAGYETKWEYLYNAATLGTATVTDGMYMDPTVEWFSQYSKAGFKYTAVKRKMMIAPGETCVHTMKGPSGVLDLETCQLDGGIQNGMLKGFSKGVIISVSGDQVLETLPNVSASGRYIKSTGGEGSAGKVTCGMPIAMEVEEFMKISVPNVAGFTRTAPAEGTRETVQLNNRRPKYIHWQRSTVNGAPIFQVANELTPVNGIDSSGVVAIPQV